MLENKVVKLAIAYLLIMLIGFIYNKYKKTIDIQEQYNDGRVSAQEPATTWINPTNTSPSGIL